mgnify:CR=1 FL=1
MRYFIIAGEASGDLHASNLMASLKREDPAAEFCFLGGDLMLEQGGTMVRHYRDMAFMGFIPVLLHARTILKNMKDCKQALLDFNPDVLILVDYPSFNLKIAKFAKKNLKDLPVFYYISPKLWAWKEYRLKSIKKYVDKVYSILPFEVEWYKDRGYEIEYVGNPCVDAVSSFVPKYEDRGAFLKHLNVPDRPVLAILAGISIACGWTIYMLCKNTPINNLIQIALTIICSLSVIYFAKLNLIDNITSNLCYVVSGIEFLTIIAMIVAIVFAIFKKQNKSV